MKITIVCVGKIKEDFYTKAIWEYSKRLSRYCKLEILEVADEKTPDGAGAALERQIKEKEGERIRKAIKEDSFVVALAIEGKKKTSEQFGDSHITFVIGGSLGLDEDVLKRADVLLSFSDFTFPHQLMRVILLEQIYRGFRIMKHEPYHK